MRERYYVLALVAAAGLTVAGMFAWFVVKLGNCEDWLNESQADWCNNGPISDGSTVLMYIALPPLILAGGVALKTTPAGLLAASAVAVGALILTWLGVSWSAPLF